jgi:glucose-6-phosphate 1-dehydrogenase
VAWSLISAIHEGWTMVAPPPFPNYDAGTWGPERAHELMARDGRTWRRLRTR